MHRFARSLVAGSLLVAACTAAPAEVTRESTATATARPSTPPPTAGELRARIRGIGTEPAPDDILLVGDSVMVLVTDDLATRLSSELHIDAADCRRIDIPIEGPCGGVPAGSVVPDGVEALLEQRATLADEGIVPEVAVVILANNSTVTDARLDEAMAAIPDIPRVWWVTSRIEGFGRQDPNNRALAALAERDPRAGVVDWFAASEGRDWLADNVHPNDVGQRALGRLIAEHIICDCVP